MATVFLKNPSSGSKALILDPREAVVYPFGFTGYSEIRMGAFISFSSSGSDIGQYSNENTTVNFSTNKYNNVFIGVKDSGLNAPLESGQYIGTFSSTTGTLIKLDSGNSIISDNFSTLSIGAAERNFTGVLNNNSSHVVNLPSINQVTGNTGYAMFYGIGARFFNIGTTGQSFSGFSMKDTTPITNVSISNLQNKILNPATTTFAPEQFFTSGLTGGGGALPLPNSVYIYSPFLNNRIIIHSLIAQIF